VAPSKGYGSSEAALAAVWSVEVEAADGGECLEDLVVRLYTWASR